MWKYNYAYPIELRHYGVKGMKWGIRRAAKALDKIAASSRIKMNLQLFGKRSKSRKTVRLPVQEFAMVMHELRTNITKDEKTQPIVRRAIGDHHYSFENHFDDTYRVIGKRKIRYTNTGLYERERKK